MYTAARLLHARTRRAAAVHTAHALHVRQATVCASLFKRGWCTVDGLLDEEHARGARAEAAGLFRQGGYSRSYSLVEETGEKLWRPNVFMAELVCHTGLEPRTSRQGPRQVCNSHVRALPWTGLGELARLADAGRAAEL